MLLNAAAACVLVEGRYDHFIERLEEKMNDCRAAIEAGSATARLKSWVTAASRFATTPLAPDMMS